MVNLILGLGGTGAKIVESYIHLCATGLGPPQTKVAFIDQDQANGNTQRARMTLARYTAARAALQNAGGEHPEPECRLLDTQLVPHPDPNDVDGCHWVPQRERDVNLADLTRYNLMKENSQGLARALFRYDEELCMRLNEGFRGRPHVGSAALLMQLERDEFWTSLEEVVTNASREVRVFLCGSAFGGTGAAFLPTLARRLRQAANRKHPLRTGCALMLPYFTFPLPEDREENVAAGHQLLLQSQSALQYYHEMEFAEKPHSFDDLYFVGWDPAIELTYHSLGAGTQVNPPLAPELFGALAAARFFCDARAEVKGGGGSDPPKLHVVGRAASGRLGWDDLPPVRDDEPPATAYATWLRFCALWRFNYARALGGECPAGAKDEAWYRKIFGQTDPDQADKDFSKYVDTALQYAAAMAAFSTWHGDATPFDLWTHGPIAAVDPEDPTTEPDLSRAGLVDGLEDFKDLVRGFDEAPDASDIYWAISEKASPKSKGLWPLVAFLQRECAPRAG